MSVHFIPWRAVRIKSAWLVTPGLTPAHGVLLIASRTRDRRSNYAEKQGRFVSVAIHVNKLLEKLSMPCGSNPFIAACKMFQTERRR
jgi:hypothetical protein